MEKVAFELGLQNSPDGEQSPKKGGQHKPRLEDVTVPSAFQWSRTLMELTESFCGTGAETKAGAGQAESWSDGATLKDKCGRCAKI